MSVFGTNQREELIVGDAVAAETTKDTFIASATDKEIKVLSADGTAPAAGEDFYVLQKAAAAVKGYEFSDKIKPSKVDKVILAEYSAEVQKSVTATVDSAAANTTYAIEVRVYNTGGSLSVENFDVVSGYYVTGSSAETVGDIRDGLITSLQANFSLRGDNEVTISANGADAIDIVGQAQTVIRGKDIGSQIEFDVTGKSFSDPNLVQENTGLISVVVNNGNDPGVGTGKYAVNLEWFTKGFAYDIYRGAGYPADFENVPYYTAQGTNYNAIHIKYFDDRDNPTVEKQNKVLTILVERADLAANVNTNAVLADLRTVLGAGNVPSDLAVA
jgi:hypothetical protein